MRTLEELKAITPKIREVPQKLFRTDGGTQYREGIDEGTMKSYLLAMKEGAAFPPVETLSHGQYHRVMDGFHCLAAIGRCSNEL